MRRQPPSDFGTRPSGEDVYGTSGDRSETLPGFKSASSCSEITDGASVEVLRLSDRMNTAGPV